MRTVARFLARFDPLSQQMLQRFARKVVVLTSFAAILTFAMAQEMALIGAMLQMQCFIGSAVSMLVATLMRQPFDSDTITYWDEAVAFSGLGLLGHIAWRLALPG